MAYAVVVERGVAVYQCPGVEVEHGVELFVLVEYVLGEAYVFLQQKLVLHKVAAGAAGEVELFHVCAAADGVAELYRPAAVALGFFAGLCDLVVEVQHLWLFAVQLVDALPVCAAGDECVVAVDEFYVCSLCLFYAAVACGAGATVCGGNEPDACPAVFLPDPQWWRGGAVVNDDYLIVAGGDVQPGDAIEALFK